MRCVLPRGGSQRFPFFFMMRDEAGRRRKPAGAPAKMLTAMAQTYRRFQAGPDPFGRTWNVEFQWLQTGISIRHADTVDVKFHVETEGEPPVERVIALRHPDVVKLSAATGHALTDAWCLKLAALHLQHMIVSGEDMEKTLVTAEYGDIEKYAAELKSGAAA